MDNQNIPNDERSFQFPTSSSSSSSSTSSKFEPQQILFDLCPNPNQCLICQRELPPCLISRSVSWVSILRVVFYSLKRLYPDKEFFNLKKDVYGYVNAHWDVICSKKKKTNGWRKQLQDALSHCRRLFESGAERHDCYGYWRLKDNNDPWEDNNDYNSMNHMNQSSNPSSPTIMTTTTPILSPSLSGSEYTSPNTLLSPGLYSSSSNTTTPLLTSSSKLSFNYDLSKLSMSSPIARPRSKSLSFDQNINYQNNNNNNYFIKHQQQPIPSFQFHSYGRDQKVPKLSSIGDDHPIELIRPFQLNGSPPTSNPSSSPTRGNTSPQRFSPYNNNNNSNSGTNKLSIQNLINPINESDEDTVVIPTSPIPIINCENYSPPQRQLPNHTPKVFSTPSASSSFSGNHLPSPNILSSPYSSGSSTPLSFYSSTPRPYSRQPEDSLEFFQSSRKRSLS